MLCLMMHREFKKKSDYLVSNYREEIQWAVLFRSYQTVWFCAKLSQLLGYLENQQATRNAAQSWWPLLRSLSS